MVIKIVDNMDSPWAVGLDGELLINIRRANEIEDAYYIALESYISQLNKEELELLENMPATLAYMFMHVKEVLPDSELTQIIKAFKALKDNFTEAR